MMGLAQRDPSVADPRPAAGSAAGALLEVRMLGSFQVRRPDGSIVDPGEWRTGKAADLVRMLALQAGEPIPATTLVATLWPGSDQRRGQASLRTAASRVRHVLGSKFLERSLAGLRLCETWVDVTAFRAMAAQAHRLAGSGEPADVDAIARQAVALYRGDLRAHDDGADWAQAERSTLAATYQILLCDAAEAAVNLDLARDAVDFATRALAQDPFSERASRLLMRGHAGNGEMSLALREFERCRALLAEELGTDPSPQTRELHLFLLRTERAPTNSIRPVSSRPAAPVELSYLGDPVAAAESRLQLALDVCIPQRQFARARRYADEAAAVTGLPALRARAIAASALPDALLGRSAVASAALEQGALLAAATGADTFGRRLEPLRCLVAHDTDGPDFEARWTHAAARCESETDVNWAWAMIRIATERGELDAARMAASLPVAESAGPLARQLHSLASAALLADLGQTLEAAARLRALVDSADGAQLLLVLPEALARLAILCADSDPGQADVYLSRLDEVLGSQPAMPRDLYFRQLALAAVLSANGRDAAAAAAAAGGGDIAEANGLVFLTAAAHERCARYAARAQAGSARANGAGVLRLTLALALVR